MADKPWTKPGLTAHRRALLLLGRPTQPAIEEALAAHARDAAPKWTPVAEGLPQSDIYVWGFDGAKVIKAWHSSTFGWRDEGMRIVGISHWQEIYIPVPPTEED